MPKQHRIIDGKIKDDGGPSRISLSIYFDEKDRGVVPRIDKSCLRLNFDGQIYEGTISLHTSHPPYLLTWLVGPKGRLRCTDLFLDKGWNNGAVLRFEVTERGQEFKCIKTIAAGSPLPKQSAPSRSLQRPDRKPQPKSQKAPDVKELNPYTVEVWAERYWDLIKIADKDEELKFEREFSRARKAGHLSRDLFIRMGVWKSARNRSRLESNSEETITQATQQAFQASSRKEPIRILSNLNGVAVRTAVAMLHWMKPDEFPMLDFRVVRALGLDEPNDWEDLNYYDAFAHRVIALAKQLKVDLRTLDRALWAMDLESQRSPVASAAS